MTDPVDNAKAGEDSPRSFDAAELYQRHAAGLRMFLLKQLHDPSQVDDVLQQTFRRFQEQKTKASQNGDSFHIHAGWLYQVAKNEALLVHRKQARKKKHEPRIASFLVQLRSGDRDLLIEAEQAKRVQDACQKLPEILRRVVELRIYEDMKFVEIAEFLKLPQGTVLSRMARALKILRVALSDMNSGDEE
ncbi:RNA polymerase sigma factor [Rubinisphaera margarita]|uniref:RNA polymerase sigma factor n=1 Tax=Rubinisphaera margarita TaxID=2909586 RepID=UPI001EE94240|nr:sigma-70 family RNA polymerase sigma factor [Rubinisphaera margarita]MCG6154670.1 sigma-70 family RNA polymerase sigma factor [Rubinisphaera margarita]